LVLRSSVFILKELVTPVAIQLQSQALPVHPRLISLLSADAID
jgi:hypothetical protein